MPALPLCSLFFRLRQIRQNPALCRDDTSERRIRLLPELFHMEYSRASDPDFGQKALSAAFA
jgi:hypothetical protein